MALLGAKPPYDNMQQAYAHLAKDDVYQPYEPRDEGSWVVVLHTETMAVRLFKTLEDVGRMFSWDTYRQAVYIKPSQMAAKHTSAKLAELCAKVKIDAAGKTGLALAAALWDWCQAHGDKVTGEKAEDLGLRHDQERYKVRVDLLKDPEMQPLLATLPKQAQVIAQALADAEKTAYDDDAMLSFARGLVISQQLKTKQDAMRVVMYYMPALNDLGLVAYNRKEKKDGAT